MERNFFLKSLCDGSEPSSKRIVGVIGAIVLFLVFLVHSFCNIDKAPDSFMAGTIASIVFGALAITAYEKKTNKANQEPKQPE